MSTDRDLPPDHAVEETTWHWLLADEAGVVVTEPDVVFDSQQAAEDWLRDQFEELLENGVASVSLLDGEHAVYGPMYLAPEADGSAAAAQI